MPHPFHAKAGRQGSALLLTLLTVSILLVLVLALVVLVRLEVRSVANQQELLQARSTARLGMELALGRLQDLAGPDQRATATADLFQSTAGNLAQATLQRGENKRHWVGVWDSRGYDEQDATSKPFLGWLVSTPDATQVDQVGDAAGEAAGADLAVLVGEGTVALATDRVLARKVPLPAANGADAAFAYWVGDEGVKARFNLRDPYRGSSDAAERQNSFKAAQRLGVERMRPEAGSPSLDDLGLHPFGNSSFDGKVARLLLPDQWPLLGEGGSPAHETYERFRRHRFHETTLLSRGVLSDTRNGGLKRDLTLAFEMPLDDFNASEFAAAADNAELPVYRPAGLPANEKFAPIFSITDFSPYGFTPENSPNDRAQNPQYLLPPVLRAPPWHLVRNYYRMYRESDADRAAYGLDPRIANRLGGEAVFRGSSMFPTPNGLNTLRRYGQDAAVWTYAEDYGPRGSRYTVPVPIGRPLFPSVAPVITRMQTAISLRSRPDGSNYVTDLYIDPIVSLWNPYNVPLTTGHRNGQPLQISVSFLDFIIHMEGYLNNVRVGAYTFSETLDRILDNTASASANQYDRFVDETYMVDIDLPSGFRMEPGEVILLSGQSGVLPYTRTTATGNMDTGIRMKLSPGIGYLPEETGFLVSNPFAHKLPDGTSGHIPPEMELRFRIRNRDSNSKFRLAGVNRTGSGEEPFFVSLQPGIVLLDTAWSERVRVSDPSMTEEKRPLMNYDAYLKPEDSPSPVNLVSQYNPRAHCFEQGTTFRLQSSAYQSSAGSDIEEDLWYGIGVLASGWGGSWLSTHSGGRGTYWGQSNRSASGKTHVVLYELPTTPMLSLGSLQHAPLTLMADEPSAAVGNSFAPIFVRPHEKISRQMLNDDNVLRRYPENGRAPAKRTEWTMTRPDWSYLLNETLWDGYFFSSLAPANDADSGIARLHSLQAGLPLPNSGISLLYRPGETPDALADKLFAPGGSRAVRREAPRLAAENLMVDGAFNIHSTSVEAWRALLSSTRRLALDLAEGGSATLSGTGITRTAFPAGPANDKWNGFRDLSDAQIDRLAEEIVKQVRIRGPFLNLADFVN